MNAKSGTVASYGLIIIGATVLSIVPINGDKFDGNSGDAPPVGVNGLFHRRWRPRYPACDLSRQRGPLWHIRSNPGADSR